MAPRRPDHPIRSRSVDPNAPAEEQKRARPPKGTPKIRLEIAGLTPARRPDYRQVPLFLQTPEQHSESSVQLARLGKQSQSSSLFELHPDGQHPSPLRHGGSVLLHEVPRHA